MKNKRGHKHSTRLSSCSSEIFYLVEICLYRLINNFIGKKRLQFVSLIIIIIAVVVAIIRNVIIFSVEKHTSWTV